LISRLGNNSVPAVWATKRSYGRGGFGDLHENGSQSLVKGYGGIPRHGVGQGLNLEKYFVRFIARYAGGRAVSKRSKREIDKN
jgi:hypothetical protein